MECLLCAKHLLGETGEESGIQIFLFSGKVHSGWTSKSMEQIENKYVIANIFDEEKEQDGMLKSPTNERFLSFQ